MQLHIVKSGAKLTIAKDTQFRRKDSSTVRKLFNKELEDAWNKEVINLVILHLKLS